MINNLIKLANYFDSTGLRKEADRLDAMIRKIGHEMSPYGDEEVTGWYEGVKTHVHMGCYNEEGSPDSKIAPPCFNIVGRSSDAKRIDDERCKSGFLRKDMGAT